jgi:hypothetical protein
MVSPLCWAIISTHGAETIIEEHRGKQAEIPRKTLIELVDHLPWS